MSTTVPLAGRRLAKGRRRTASEDLAARVCEDLDSFSKRVGPKYKTQTHEGRAGERWTFRLQQGALYRWCGRLLRTGNPEIHLFSGVGKIPDSSELCLFCPSENRRVSGMP